MEKTTLFNYPKKDQTVKPIDSIPMGNGLKEIEEKKDYIGNWFLKFRNEGTRQGYNASLRTFFMSIYNLDELNSQNKDAMNFYLNKYFKEIDKRVFLNDFNRFINYMLDSDLASLSIHERASRVRKFFDRHDIEIKKRDWDDLRQQALPLKKTITQDEILTKDQLRKVIGNLDVSAKALVLVLLSTGSRIDAVLQFRTEDLELDKDPPRINTRSVKQSTQKQIPPYVYMSYEAKEALQDWLNLKPTMKKRGKYGKSEGYSKELVFGIGYSCMNHKWTRALDKIGLGKQDPKSDHRIYHIHTLRKFFKTEMAEDGVSEQTVNAWMGHSGYLPEYNKLSDERKGDEYKKHMRVVTVFEGANISEFEKKLEKAKQQIEQKDDDLSNVYKTLDRMGIDHTLPLEERLLIAFKLTQLPIPEIPKPIQVEPEKPKKKEDPSPGPKIDEKPKVTMELVEAERKSTSLYWCPAIRVELAKLQPEGDERVLDDPDMYDYWCLNCDRRILEPNKTRYCPYRHT